jgi:hypothetical protein
VPPTTIRWLKVFARSQDAFHQIALQIPRFTCGVERIRCCQSRTIRSTGPTWSSWATKGLEVCDPCQDQAAQIGEIGRDSRLLLALLEQVQASTDPAQSGQGLGLALERGTTEDHV